MTSAELVAMLERHVCDGAEVYLETETLRLLPLASARLELAAEGPGRVVLEGGEPAAKVKAGASLPEAVEVIARHGHPYDRD